MDLTTLLILTTIATVKQFFDAAAYAAGLPTSTWIKGLASWGIREAVTQLLFRYVAAQDPIIRAQWLALATDPGDPDPYNPGNVLLPPAAGFLSAIGQNVYGTTRITATFASGTMQITNNSGAPLIVTPQGLQFQSNTPASDGSFPTYHSDVGPYVNNGVPGTLAAGGSFTIANGTSATFALTADLAGSISNAASAGIVTTLMNGLPGITVTNTTAILGSDRETAPAYRLRCQAQSSATSPNGPAQAYAYLANTLPPSLGGGPLLNSNGTPVAINRVYVSQSSSTGQVAVYYATPSGGAAVQAFDKAAADANLAAWAIPGCANVATAKATDVTVNVTYTVKAKAAPGVTTTQVQNAISTALTNLFANEPIGGDDQTAGAGTFYADRVKSTIAGAWPTIYHTTMTSPAGDTALALGQDAVLGTVTPSVTLV